jgi:hypothetical protein
MHRARVLIDQRTGVAMVVIFFFNKLNMFLYR